MKFLTPTVKQGRRFYRLLTSKSRPLPDFLIIGAQKGGTSSLYDYMIQHPRIVRAMVKEVHFFDVNYHQGINWYRSYFPTLKAKGRHNHSREKVITGEASPYYIFHPHVARRVRKTVPEVKLIAALRNPVDRAFSHYNHNFKRNTESRSFGEAIAEEEKTLEGELAKMLKDESYQSLPYNRHSYLARGKYIDQLEVWTNHFPKEQLLILKSEDFYEDPSLTLKQVYEFLDLPAWELEDYKVRNPGRYSREMRTATSEYLIDYFKPYNQRLYDFLGRDLGWNS